MSDPNEERLRSIWEEHSGRVLAYAVRRLRSEEAAKDVVAETFLQAWRRIDALPQDSLPWLLGTARRVISHHLRSARSRQALRQKLQGVSTTDRGGSEVEGAWARERLVVAFESLGLTDQEILTLVDWEGLSNEQAATVMSCSVSTFAVRLHRARRRLKRLLAEDAHDTSPEQALFETPEEAR